MYLLGLQPQLTQQAKGVLFKCLRTTFFLLKTCCVWMQHVCSWKIIGQVLWVPHYHETAFTWKSAGVMFFLTKPAKHWCTKVDLIFSNVFFMNHGVLFCCTTTSLLSNSVICLWLSDGPEFEKASEMTILCCKTECVVLPLSLQLHYETLLCGSCVQTTGLNIILDSIVYVSTHSLSYLRF